MVAQAFRAAQKGLKFKGILNHRKSLGHPGQKPCPRTKPKNLAVTSLHQSAFQSSYLSVCKLQFLYSRFCCLCFIVLQETGV